MDLGAVPPLPTRVSLQGQTLHMGTTVQTMEDRMINAQISDGNRSRDESFSNHKGNGRNNGRFSRSPSTQRRDFSQKKSYRQPRSDQPNNSAVRRLDNRSTTSFTPYEQKFPQTNTQTSSIVVRFTTTDDTINEL